MQNDSLPFEPTGTLIRDLRYGSGVGGVASGAVVLRYSQGGQGALFAGQRAPSYVPNLKVIGVAAASPTTELSKLYPQRAVLTSPGAATGYLVIALYAWSMTYKGVPLTIFLQPSVASEVEATVGCECESKVQREFATNSPASIVRSSSLADSAMAAILEENDPGGW